MQFHADTVQFEEDENMIQMEVHASQDFDSDGDRHMDSENEEGNVYDSSSASEASETKGSQSEFDKTHDQSSVEEEDYAEATPKKKVKARKKRAEKRQSVEDKLDTLSNAVILLQSLMEKKGLFDTSAKKTAKGSNKKKDPASNNRTPQKGEVAGVNSSNSETTIYQNAVEFMDVNQETNQHKEGFYEINDPEITFKSKTRDSTSSEDHVNTSDELMEIDINEQFIAECAAEASQVDKRNSKEQPQLVSTSEQVICEVEAAKARMFKTPGNEQIDMYMRQGEVSRDIGEYSGQGAHQIQHSALVDKNYMVVGAHIDKVLKQKILANEYVDFAKLMSKDKILHSDNNETKMELDTKGGSTFFVPASDNVHIANFAKWEQAFRIFANIYTKVYPWKSSELIQYNHVICAASQNFAWENVYSYDKEFHMHISNFPQRSWAIILQQAWTMCLKDCVNKYDEFHGGGNKPRGKIKEPCRRFNKGLCKKGNSCCYEHKCTVPQCGKFGHGAHIYSSA